jgi:hypothetical protein
MAFAFFSVVFLFFSEESPSSPVRQCEAFVVPIQCPRRRIFSIETLLNAAFKQKPGESDLDFIKRITKESSQLGDQAKASPMASAQGGSPDEDERPKKGAYQRIEDWEEQNKRKGEHTWDQKVQFDGQRLGNQVRQNDILIRNLHTF